MRVEVEQPCPVHGDDRLEERRIDHLDRGTRLGASRAETAAEPVIQLVWQMLERARGRSWTTSRPRAGRPPARRHASRRALQRDRQAQPRGVAPARKGAASDKATDTRSRRHPGPIESCARAPRVPARPLKPGDPIPYWQHAGSPKRLAVDRMLASCSSSSVSGTTGEGPRHAGVARRSGPRSCW